MICFVGMMGWENKIIEFAIINFPLLEAENRKFRYKHSLK